MTARNRTSMTNAADIVTKYLYDDVDRLTKMTEDFQGNDETNTKYAYNGLGLLTSLEDAEENATTYDYDPAARVTKAIYPDTGVGTNSVTYVYDLANSAIKRTDQNGITATTRFNDLHQLISRVFRNESQQVLLSEQYSFDRSSRLLSAINARSKVYNAYDDIGRIIETQQYHVWAGGTSNGFTTTFAYDVDSNSTRTIQYPDDGRTVVETADYRGRMVGLDGGTDVGGTWTYDLGNRRTTAALANYFKSRFSYDANDRLTQTWQYHSGPPFPFIVVHHAVDYGYDAVGNRTSARDYGREDRGQVYEYDRRHRLIEFKRGTFSGEEGAHVITQNDELEHPVLPGKQEWELDSRGNWNYLIEFLNSHGTLQWHFHNGANEVTQIEPDAFAMLPAVTLTYDANGNLTLDPLAPNVGTTVPDGQRYEYP